MNQELISIVIPAYNESKNIEACLRSIKAQDYQGPYEVIVTDNDSSDNTAQLARQEGATVLFEARPGVIFARETGTKAAKGSIIIQTDADTTFPTTWLSNIMDTFSKNPIAVAVIGSFKFADGPWWGKPFTALLFGITALVNKFGKRMVYIPGANTAFKKKYWHGYDLKLDQGGDEVALLKALRKEGQIIFLRRNFVLTSARRLEKGLLYNIFVILIYYYIFDYTWRRLTGRGIASPFPRIRHEVKDLEEEKNLETA
ncbi:MAG: glycosyltransferase family 2 protein [Candidatus Falkowbacteria bacterium]|nr:glycosyltransferase family 2 protein [Candidatus Falkowbacteria bacterium]